MDLMLGSPRCERPPLVMPVRLDVKGVTGPTRQQARSRAWRRSAHGWVVPAHVDRTVVEQRILEQAVRLPESGVITGWASLRWQGARFFDGAADGGRTLLPVTLLPGRAGNLRAGPGAVISRAQLAPFDRVMVDGVRCATPVRAVFDEIVRTGRLRPAVIALDMACAAGLLTLGEFADSLDLRIGWTGVPLARSVVPLADPHSRSRLESRLRLIAVIDAGLPPPLCNRAVFDLEGRLLGYPDLLDERAGLVMEYDGAHHRDAEQHRDDVVRESLFRDHRLEYATFVGPDLDDLDCVVDRMLRARTRALFLPPDQRPWTLQPPPWWNRPLFLEG